MTNVNPLNIALTGLKVAQAQIAVTSNNISNASTPGYTRKTAEQYSTIIGTDQAGVELGIVQRRINEILLRDYRTQVSSAAGLQTRLGYLEQLQDFQGPPDSEQSVTAYIDRLKNTFSQLANQPESPYLLNATAAAAQQVVDKFSGYSQKISELRNFTQTEIGEAVQRVNAAAEQVAELNISIKIAQIRGQSTAELEDLRDNAIKTMAEDIDLSYFRTQEGVLEVMTREGQLIVSTSVIPLTFSGNIIGPGSYYPASAPALKLGTGIAATDLTTLDSVGGRLGALLKLRDETLPVYQAQADEAAHKLATRLSSQGLDLFTKPNGTIPANTPASYVGFAADMVVNPAVVGDKTLIRKGTTIGSTVQDGSAEVLRKIVEFAFGAIEHQQSRGTVNISNPVPTLFTTLGISGQARLVGTANIQSLVALDDSAFINPPAQDDFTIQVGVAAPQTITITAGMTATGLVGAINAAYPGMAQLGSGGELILTANNTLTIGAGSLGAQGLAALGLSAGATAAQPPSFTIAAGNNVPTTIQILSTDTSTDLLAKLNAVSGITASLTGAGFLNVKPTQGGDITLTDGVGTPLAALGMVETNVTHPPFNVTNLGPGANLNGRVSGATTIQNFMSQAISLQAQDASVTKASFAAEDNYRAAIEKEYLDDTGVNIDEEMARLINIQTAYSASANTIRVAQEMLDELIRTFLR